MYRIFNEKLIHLSITAILLCTVLANEARAGDELGLLEAVTLTLSLQPEIRLEREQVEIDRGVYLEESGEFDTELDISVSYDHTDLPLSSEEQAVYKSSNQVVDEGRYTLGAKKLLRSGIEINPSVSVVNTETSTSEFEPATTGRVDFLITLPLLKGRGVAATAAGEMAAKVNVEASELTLRHTIAEKVLDTVDDYWSYLATKKIYNQLVESEARAKQMVASIEALIAADEVPASDLQRMQANLSDKTTSRITNLQNIVEAQQQLGLTIGLDYSDFFKLENPTSEFPDLEKIDLDQLPHMLKELLDLSLLNRSDYLSASKVEESNRILLTAAENNLKPKLDLDLNFGFAGQDEGRSFRTYYSSLYKDIPGISQSVVLRYTFPPSNTISKGLYLQRMATLRQSKIQLDNLVRTIFSNVTVALESVRNQGQALAEARQAVEAYREALQNEKEKFRLGMSTLLDIIDTDDRLTDAVLNEINTHLQFAFAIARLRFETGTIIAHQDGKFSVDLGMVTHIPEVPSTNP